MMASIDIFKKLGLKKLIREDHYTLFWCLSMWELADSDDGKLIIFDTI